MMGVRISKWLFFLCLGWGLLTLCVGGCTNSNDFHGTPPDVGEADDVIIFSAANWPDVVFTHRKHAVEYWNSNCFACHSHANVRDQTIWKCSECHSSDDGENLCMDDANGHDCMYAQCLQCHEAEETNPTPDCASCHVSVNTGQLVDSAVSGVTFTTPTQKGVTDTGGRFNYRPGEIVTFSIGGITLGSGLAKAAMTPVDLVPGAVDETDPTVINIARFLQSLDEDGDLSNGITIPNTLLNVVADAEIDFSVSPAEFAANADLLAILTALNKTLVDENDAKTHLKETLDVLYPPPPTGVIITGIPDTHFVLIGDPTYSEDINGSDSSLTFQWLRADDAAGANETAIAGATQKEYQPKAGDVDKYLLFRVTPSSGDAVTSNAVGPVTSLNILTYYSVVSAATEVDQYKIRLTASTDVTVDVESSERSHEGYYYDYRGYYPLDIPSDLNFPEGGPSNGSNNDWLISNIYFFQANGSVVDYREGTDLCYACSTCHYTSALGLPGCDAPNAFQGRSPENPYITMSTLPAGDYILSIGAQPLNLADAWTGTNTNGSITGYNSGGYNNYRITFTFVAN